MTSNANDLKMRAACEEIAGKIRAGATVSRGEMEDIFVRNGLSSHMAGDTLHHTTPQGYSSVLKRYTGLEAFKFTEGESFNKHSYLSRKES